MLCIYVFVNAVCTQLAACVFIDYKIPKVTSGVRFNGEGYAQLPIASGLVNNNLTNIMFSFKTTQVTGLLLQLGEEVSVTTCR